MIRRFKKYRRAEKVGWAFRDNLTGRRVWYWHDPKTGQCWMATKRYPVIVRVETDLNIERVRKMLKTLPECTLVDDSSGTDPEGGR